MPEWTSMLSWWQWAALGAVPPAIVALYFLKLKRLPLEVPSTYLWHKSIEDLHVNSIWQRLRKNILLLLQLLLMLLLIVVLLRPHWQGEKRLGNRSIFLVDNSASMGATDGDSTGKATRLDEAKRKVAELIDQMESGDAGMIISFADSARVEQPFTDDRRQLQRALEAIRQTARPTALGEALRLASGLANPGRSGDRDSKDYQVAEPLPADLYILSDGKFPDVSGFALGHLKPTFMPIGNPESRNIAIVAFGAQRPEEKPDVLQVFGRLENYSPSDASVEVELYRDGQLTDADKVKIGVGDSAGVAFNMPDIETGVLRLKVRGTDALAVDDEAWLVVAHPRRAKVLLVTPGNPLLEKVLRTDMATEAADLKVAGPEFLDSEDYARQATAGSFDLILYDRCQPKTMPQSNTFFIGRLPPEGWSAKPAATGLQVIDSDHAHPLMSSIELGDVAFVEGTPLVVPPGGRVLADSNRGPLLVIAPREAFEDLVLGSELLHRQDNDDVPNTSWHLRLSFPLFAFNTLKYLGRAQDAAAIPSQRPGQPVVLRSEAPLQHVSVRTPQGRTMEVPRGRLGTFNVVDTEERGVYEVTEGDKVTQRFAVNLLDSTESDIRPREKLAIKIGYVEVAGQTNTEVTRREAWKWLVLGALALLLVEWYIYNRRVYL